MEFVLPNIETVEVLEPQANTVEDEENVQAEIKDENGEKHDPVESQVKAVYERRRLAQLVAAKKKLRSFRQQKAKKLLPSPVIDPSPEFDEREPSIRMADTSDREEDPASSSSYQRPVTPMFLAPSWNASASSSGSGSHSRARSKCLSPIDLALVSPSPQPASINQDRCQDPGSMLLGMTGTSTGSSETRLAGRRKREALKPIRVQEMGRSGSGSGSGIGLGLGLGIGLGIGWGMSGEMGGGDVHSETSFRAEDKDKESDRPSPLRDSPRSSENRKRRSFKKTVPTHRHTGSADSLRRLGSGWSGGRRPEGRSVFGDNTDEEMGIRTAPGRLEGVGSDAGPGLGGLGEPFSIPGFGARLDSAAEETELSLEMLGLDFSIPMDIHADAPGEMPPFSFPQRKAFGRARNEVEGEVTDERPVSILPELAVVPSTPAWEEFSLPALDLSSPGRASTSSPSPVPEERVKQRFEGFKFGQPTPAVSKPTMAAFSFGKKLEPVIVKPDPVADDMPVSAVSMPSLPSTPTRKKRHFHTRSGSVSSYHAFLPHSGVPAAPRSPGMLSIDQMPLAFSSPSGRLSPGPSSPTEAFDMTSPVKAPGDIKLDREGALRTLEGARNGLAAGASVNATSNLTWPMPGVDGLFGRDGRRLSAGGLVTQGKRRSRKSLMMEKAQQEAPEVQIPDLDSDEEILGQDVSSPNPFGSAPSSPRPPVKERPLSGIILAPASTRDSFEKMFKAPPAAVAPGFGLTLAPTMGASVEPHLNTLVEEEEPDEEEQEVVDPTTPRAASPIASPPAVSLTSTRMRPLRLLSMSSESASSMRPFDADDSISDRHSLSFERGRSSSIESTPMSPGSNAASDVSTRRTSFSSKASVSAMDESARVGRRPRSLVGWGKRVSNVSLSGSVRTLNEVAESTDVEDPQHTPRVTGATEQKVALPQSSRVRRRRSLTAHSIALGSFENCDDVALLKEKLADAAMERMAMEQDIQDWRARCGDLDKQLRAERQQSGVLRDRVRRLGDHLSQISSAASPSEPSVLEVDTPSQMMASMRDQLFKLAQEVERERKAKVDALANVAGLQVRLEALAPVARVDEPTYQRGAGHPLGVTSPDPTSRLRGFAFPRGSVPLSKGGLEPKDELGATLPPASSHSFELPRPRHHLHQEELDRLPPVVALPTSQSSRQLDFRTCCGVCRGNVIEL